MTPIAKRAAVQVMVEDHQLSRVRACKAVELSSSRAVPGLPVQHGFGGVPGAESDRQAHGCRARNNMPERPLSQLFPGIQLPSTSAAGASRPSSLRLSPSEEAALCILRIGQAILGICEHDSVP